MSCIMDLVKELHDYNKKQGLFERGSLSYGWSFGIAWGSVAAALIGPIISTIGLLKSPTETNTPIGHAPTMSLKK